VDPVLAWLLDPAEPAVRAQALVDLLRRPEDDLDVREARAEAAARGSAARVLSGVVLSGRDARALYRPKYVAPFHRLVALAEMGVPATDPAAGALLEACLDAFLGDPRENEVCLTGNLARAAWRMGRGSDPRVADAVRWLAATQLPDGGWHCWPDEDPRGTLDAWEALGAFAAIPPAARSAEVRAAAARGVEFLLERRLGMDDPYEPWRRLHAPRHYYYDVLVGLDLATALGDPTDPRLRPALAWLRAKRGADGRWHADRPHPDLGPGADYALRPGEAVTPLVVEPEGEPSRWLTLAALRVLRRTGAGA